MWNECGVVVLIVGCSVWCECCWACVCYVIGGVFGDDVIWVVLKVVVVD